MGKLFGHEADLIPVTGGASKESLGDLSRSLLTRYGSPKKRSPVREVQCWAEMGPCLAHSLAGHFLGRV